jgi:HD superfamily phosphohydrolase
MIVLPDSKPYVPVCIADPVYGEVCLTEPLLIDLYHSAAVQRLKHIHQGGITAFIKPTRKTTRLDHSTGVTALLRILDATLEEQAAGLIHDVPHTAFSHVIDFVYPNSEHDYHEKNSEAQIVDSDLPQVLAEYQLDWRMLTDSARFSLLEQPLPRLCADRLDYFFRDGVVDVGTFTTHDVTAFLEHVRPYQGEIVVDDIDAARWLGEQFMILDNICWCSVQEVGWYAVMARALQEALAQEVITSADFRSTDAVILTTLQSANSPQIDYWLQLLRTDVDFIRVNSDPDLVTLPKVRAVDPPVLQDNGVIPLSTLDRRYAQHKETYIKSKQGEWYLRILDRKA